MNLYPRRVLAKLLGFAELSVLCILCACSSSSAGSSSSSGSSGTIKDAGSIFADTGAPTNNQTGCADATKLIYIVSSENALYRYNPETDDLKVTGLVRCDGQSVSPTSMAVDRSGTAWVRFADGTMNRVATSNAECTPTSFFAPDGAFAQFGMGFSSVSATTGNEQLYLADSRGAGLATLSTKNFILTKIGPFTGAVAGQRAELTGTGDGRLFGFFTQNSPAKIGQIDKDTGAVSQLTDLPGVSATSDWAFAFYGGSFYTFTASASAGGLPMNESGSSVHRYNPTDGTVKEVKQFPFRVVGAGVSTCAPIVPQLK